MRPMQHSQFDVKLILELLAWPSSFLAFNEEFGPHALRRDHRPPFPFGIHEITLSLLEGEIASRRPRHPPSLSFLLSGSLEESHRTSNSTIRLPFFAAGADPTKPVNA